MTDLSDLIQEPEHYYARDPRGLANRIEQLLRADTDRDDLHKYAIRTLDMYRAEWVTIILALRAARFAEPTATEPAQEPPPLTD